ncbi:MAG: hypothetical protein IPJ20_10500 [Flammeovirgaceae bacterium]|nr:hypothetical protein [Flammeovirgaceae bacterium]
MNKIIAFGLVLLSTTGFSQRFILSDSATISVITCGPYGKNYTQPLATVLFVLMIRS